jgi:prolyl-tRNA synthetase
VRPGVMFSDADLLGVPVRLVVSPRNMKESVVELSTRDKSIQEKVAIDEVIPTIKELIQKLLDELEK